MPDPRQLPPAVGVDSDGAGAEAPATPAVPVWDIAVRTFHWTLVCLVVVSWISGGSGERLHEIAGWAIAGLIVFRIVWGFVGTRHARFRDFVVGPAGAAAYLAGVVRRQPTHYTGHNPAGALMILALVAVLLTITVSGAMMQTNRFFGIEWVETLHGIAADSLLVLVPLHVLGALVSSWLHRENLIWAMLSGQKPGQAGGAAASRNERVEFGHKGAKGLVMLTILAAVGAFYGWVSTAGRTSDEVPAAANRDAVTAEPAAPGRAGTSPGQASTGAAGTGTVAKAADASR